MPDIIQSIRTKIEFVMICLALLGMMSTGTYVYHDQTSRLNIHSADIAGMKDKAKSHEAKSQALSDVISATIIPTPHADVHALYVVHPQTTAHHEEEHCLDLVLVVMPLPAAFC
jgi:hypothetical protein